MLEAYNYKQCIQVVPSSALTSVHIPSKILTALQISWNGRVGTRIECKEGML